MSERFTRLRGALRTAPLPVAGLQMNRVTWMRFLAEATGDYRDALRLHPYPTLFGCHVIFSRDIPPGVVSLNTHVEEIGRLVLSDPEVH